MPLEGDQKYTFVFYTLGAVLLNLEKRSVIPSWKFRNCKISFFVHPRCVLEYWCMILNGK